MNWLHYIMEANIYLGIFYLAYCLFLNKETYYTLNRAYLLLSCVISFILPLVQIGILKPAEQPISQVNFAFPARVIMGNAIKTTPAAHHFTLQDGIVYGYIAGVVILLLVLLFKLYQLLKLARLGKNRADTGYKLVYLNDSNTAFSFFNFLFIGAKTNGAETIIKHELVHIRQKHSFDIIFIELLKVINWFNPFIYLLQRSLKAVHEYIADEKTATSGTDALAYSSFLINNAYGLSGSTIAHSFFNYNLLKKRIIMLHQKRSGSLARLKYLLAVPVCAGLLCVSTLGFSKNYALIDLLPRKTDTIHIAPPPPPAPPIRQVRFAAPKQPDQVTKKGYKYAESGYLVRGKANFRVIIVDNGVQKAYFRNTATAAELKLLRDKYGYTFPTMNIYPKMPPPPPAPPAPLVSAQAPRAPLPSVRPVNRKIHRLPPPVVAPDSPASIVHPKAVPLPPPPPPKNVSKSVIYTPSDLADPAAPKDGTPVIIVNGEVYNLKAPIKKGQKLIVDATRGVNAYVYTDNDLQQAIKKYGDGAKNGVIYAYGKTSVEVK